MSAAIVYQLWLEDEYGEYVHTLEGFQVVEEPSRIMWTFPPGPNVKVCALRIVDLNSKRLLAVDLNHPRIILAGDLLYTDFQ